MKKIIILFSSVVVLMGCKNNNQPDEKFPCNTKNISQLIREEEKKVFEGCTSIVVVDLNNIDQSERESWIAENKQYFCSKELSIEKANCYEEECTENIVIVDLNLIVDANSSSDENVNNLQRAKWLKKYGKYICFEKSYSNILESHRITRIQIIDEMLKLPHYDISFKDLKEDVENIEGVDYFGLDKYQKYIVISISNGNILVTTTDNFSATFACFSIPFFRSIERKFCPDDELKIEVYPFGFEGKYYTGLRVFSTTSNQTIYYLDYSNNPKFL